MNQQEIRVLIKEELKGDLIISKTYEDELYVYVFIISESIKPFIGDDRYARAGGQGPIRIDKRTKEYRRIHILEVPNEIYKNNPKPTRNSIADGIVKRQYVNERDMLNFTKMIYEGSDEDSFNFGKIFYNYKRDKEKIRAHFRSTEIRDAFKTFLESVCVRCVINSEGWLEFDRVPVQNAAE